MKKGESVAFIRPRKGYRIFYMLPCMIEKDKKMAEVKIDLKISSQEMFSILEKEFPGIKLYPDLDSAHIDFEGKEIVISFEDRDTTSFANVKIKKAKNDKDVIQTAEKLSKMIGIVNGE